MPSRSWLYLRLLPALVPGLVIWGGIPFSEARVFTTQDQALAAAFPECKIERETHYLTTEERARTLSLTGAEAPAVAIRYFADCKDSDKSAYAYFDSHVVKTRKQTLMVVVEKDSTLRKIEILAFDEPEEYLATEKWYRQFQKKKLDPELELKRGIPFITGATLTARSTLQAARRILGLHQTLPGKPRKSSSP